MDLGLRGAKAILAGASRGIGLATAKALAAEGCDVALCGRNPDSMRAAVAATESLGVAAYGEPVDIGSSDYEAWIARATASLSGCDIFISFVTAGPAPASRESWDAGFRLDLMGTYRGIAAVLPSLRRSAKASIVAIASTSALEDFAGVQAYHAMKAATIAYASALARQLAPEGIRVNTVSPGPVDGDLWDAVKGEHPELHRATLADLPTGRFASADEVARTIVFVASPACRAMVGSNIVVDSGLTRRHQY